MSKARPITAQEYESLRRGVDRAWACWLLRRKKLNDRMDWDDLDLEGWHMPIQRLEDLENNRRVSDECRLLFRIRVGRVDMESADVSDALQQNRRNPEFLREFAEIVERGIYRPQDMTRLERMLLTRWDRPHGQCPELFHFTPRGLHFLYCRESNSNGIGPGTVEKTRYRLQLPCIRREKQFVKVKNGELQFYPAQRSALH